MGVTALAALQLAAQTFESGGLNYEVNDASAWTVTLTGAPDKNAVTTLDIPDVVYYYRETADNHTEKIPCTVTAIGRNAFNSSESLSSVSMPNSVTYIGVSAFQSCKKLENISFSESLKTIDTSAFSSCVFLDAINLPSSLKTIGYSAFSGCTILSDVTLNEGLETIGQNAFSGNDGMREIVIPASVNLIDQQAFYRCNVLNTVEFKGAVASVKSRAFDYSDKIAKVYAADIETWCRMGFADGTSNPVSTAHKLYLGGELVTDIVIPSTVTEIPNYAFIGCQTLKTIKISDNVKSLGYRSFSGNILLEDIEMGNSIETIYGSAFISCKALKEITFPNSLKIIGSYCFESCESLERVNFGNGLERIDDYAFNYCEALKTVNIIDLSQWFTIKFSGASGSHPLVYADTFMLNGEEITDLVIPSDVIDIPDYAFLGGANFISITIPDNVKSIGTEAFSNCAKLETVSIGNGIKSLGLYSFATSYNIKTLRIEDGTSKLVITGNTGWASGWAIPEKINDLYIGREITVSGTFAPAVVHITLGAGVKAADGMTYTDCKSLALITALNPEPPKMSEFTEDQYSGVVVMVPQGATEAYRNAEIWKNFAIITEDPAYDLSNVKIEFDKDWYSLYSYSVPYYTPQAFTYTITPEVYAGLSVTMTPEDPNILTINDKFVPTYKHAGETIVTATVNATGATATCTVTTYQAPSKITLNDGSRLTLPLNSTHVFEYTITPMMIEPEMLTWESSNPEIIEVDQTGTAVTKNTGTASIKVTTYNKKSYSCYVTVDSSLGVADAATPADSPADVYTPQGILVVGAADADAINALAPGIYIIRQGDTVSKIVK